MPKVDCMGHDLGTFESVSTADRKPVLVGFVPAEGVPLRRGNICVDYPNSRIVNNGTEHEMLAFIGALRG